MPLGFARIVVFLFLLVLASPRLVHWTVSVSDVSAAEPRSKVGMASSSVVRGSLPAPVAEMRDAILAAAGSGRIEELRTPLEWHELKPDVGDGPVADIVTYWRMISADGDGGDILGVMNEILHQPYAELPVGRDAENSRLYVWPRFAEVAPERLTTPEREAYERIVPARLRDEMARTGRYLWWRLAIGADGTWHAFHKAK